MEETFTSHEAGNCFIIQVEFEQSLTVEEVSLDYITVGF